MKRFNIKGEEWHGTKFALKDTGSLVVRKVVAKVIKDCTICQRLQTNATNQKNGRCPRRKSRNVYTIGPFYVRQGRKEIKQYGILFLCLASRAIHLEVLHTVETDSFLNAYRQFVLRGPVKELQCDRRANICGAGTELERCLKEMDQAKIKAELLKESCDWLEFKFNLPKASHMGGTWEKQFRPVWNVFLHQNGSQLHEESLLTFMCEAESIVYSLPLSVDNLGLPDSLEPLTPNHLLMVKSKILHPLPGVFQNKDMYFWKHWRRVQHLCNEF